MNLNERGEGFEEAKCALGMRRKLYHFKYLVSFTSDQIFIRINRWIDS